MTAVGYTYRRSPARRDDPARTGRGDARRPGALQRSLLVRLRAGSHRRRSPGGTRADPAPGRSPTSAATCWTCRSSCAGRSSRSAVRRSPRSSQERPVPLGVDVRPHQGRSQRRIGSGRERGRGDLHRARSKTVRSGPSRRPGWRTTCPTGSAFELFGSKGSAAWDLHRAGEFQISADDVRSELGGSRRVLIGPDHPYIRGGLPMDAGGVGHGVADLFNYQTRAFLDQIAGIGDLRPTARLRSRLARPAGRRGDHRVGQKRRRRRQGPLDSTIKTEGTRLNEARRSTTPSSTTGRCPTPLRRSPTSA